MKNISKRIFRIGCNELYKKIKKINGTIKYKLLIFFDKARMEFRNEKLLIFYMLTMFFMRINSDLENICEM